VAAARPTTRHVSSRGASAGRCPSISRPWQAVPPNTRRRRSSFGAAGVLLRLVNAAAVNGPLRCRCSEAACRKLNRRAREAQSRGQRRIIRPPRSPGSAAQINTVASDHRLRAASAKAGSTPLGGGARELPLGRWIEREATRWVARACRGTHPTLSLSRRSTRRELRAGARWNCLSARSSRRWSLVSRLPDDLEPAPRRVPRRA